MTQVGSHGASIDRRTFMKGIGATAAFAALGPTLFATGARAAPTTTGPFTYGFYTLTPTFDPETLVAIEPTTGDTQVVATLSGHPIQAVTTLAFAPNGSLYAIDSRAGSGSLLEVDTATGVVSLVGSDPDLVTMVSMAFDATGTLYGVNARTDTLYEIDTTDGSTTAVGSGLGVSELEHAGLAVKFDGTTSQDLYLVAGNNSLNRRDDVFQLDTTSGTVVSTLADQFEAGVGVAAEFSRRYTEQLFALRRGNVLLSYDLGTGDVTRIDDLTVDGTPLDATSLATPWVAEAGIDVRPRNPRDPINPISGGVVRVAVLSTPTFDATTELDVSSLRFGAPGEVTIDSSGTITGGNSVFGRRTWRQDVDGDGRFDLVLHFRVPSEFYPSDPQATLVGLTTTGVPFQGYDDVTVVPQDRSVTFLPGEGSSGSS